MPFCESGKWRPVPLPEELSLDEEVFVIRFTCEMFRCYDDYISTLEGYIKRRWTCEATMATNLTLEEALESERSCRLLLVMFPRELYGEALSIIQHNTLHLTQLTKLLMDHFKDHPKFMRMRPSVQRDVTKQFIRKHAHKDPYPGAPYKVLPELADKYNLVTELSNQLAVADFDYQQQLRWRGEESSPLTKPLHHYKVVESQSPDASLKLCLQRCNSVSHQSWPIDDHLLTPQDRSKEGPRPVLHHFDEPYYSYHGDILMVWHFHDKFKLLSRPLPYLVFHEAIQHEVTNGLRPCALLVEMCIAMVKFIVEHLPYRLECCIKGVTHSNWECTCEELLQRRHLLNHTGSCPVVPEELVDNISVDQKLKWSFGQLSLPHKIVLMRFLCDECVWIGGLRDHMIAERLLPLGHDRHGHTHWFLPSVGYFVESHDPRGWGYYSSLNEISQLEEYLNPKGSCELMLRKRLCEHKQAIQELLESHDNYTTIVTNKYNS